MNPIFRGSLRVAIASVFLIACAGPRTVVPADAGWSREEREILQSLWIGSLEPLPPDPSNRVADDPAAVALGHRLFFDTRLSGNGDVSCATCHRPETEFQDGTPLASGAGTTNRRTMPIAGTAYSPWQFWDGRKDSQWAQALGPLESPVEHAGTRAAFAHLLAEHYAPEYEAIFGPLPDLSKIPPIAAPVEDPVAKGAWDRMTDAARHDVNRVYANLGKAIAAYERRLQYGPSRFDRYVEGLMAGDSGVGPLGADELAGLRVFIGKGQCINCHNGPLLTDNHFHNTGVAAVPGLPHDRGRATGAAEVLADEFNCLGPYSDAPAQACSELRFIVAEGHELERAFKTPSLRNVARRPPYMHAGQHASLEEVVEHYDRAPAAPEGHSELRPLRLSAREKAQLVAFLRTLSGPTAADPQLLAPPRRRGDDGGG